MSSCDCYSCNNRIRHLEAQLQDFEHRLTSLKHDLERETDDRRDAVRQVANDLSDVAWSNPTMTIDKLRCSRCGVRRAPQLVWRTHYPSGKARLLCESCHLVPTRVGRPPRKENRP